MAVQGARHQLSARWRRQAPPEVARLHGWPRSAHVSLLDAAGARLLRRVNSAGRCSGRGPASPDPPPGRARRGACGCDKGAFVVRRCRRADRAAALLVGRPRTAWQSAHGCGTARPVRKPGLRPGSSTALRPFGCAPSLGAVPSPFLAARPAVRGRVWWKERKKS